MLKVAWLVPSFLEGSGGHRTILQNIQVLIDRGYDCDVYVENQGQAANDIELKRLAEKYFGHYDCKYILGFEHIEINYDAIFATAWYTAKIVRDIVTPAKKIYFIQDFEALFNPMGDGYLMALNSYCYGLKPITIGRWLSYKMQNEYGANSQCFDFCADHSIYRPVKNVKKEKAICFVYQPDKPRRCSAIGIEALGIVKYLRPDVKIYLYGSVVKGNVWFEHENLGIISLNECNELYNKCSVGLCISSSNPSRIPFEMMASGLPVVDLYMDNNLFDMPNEGVLLAHYTPESIAEAIITILDDQVKQDQMRASGIAYMKHRDLVDGYKQFYSAVTNIIENKIDETSIYERTYTKKPVIASVIMEQMVQENRKVMQQQTKNQGIISALKKIPVIRKSKLLRKIYYIIRG